MLPALTATFLAGLLGSPHCAGMCGGFAVACAGNDAGVPWHLGRLSTYALLGATAGAFGAGIPGPAWIPVALSTAGIVWFSAVLAGLVKEPKWALPGLEKISTRLAGNPARWARFLFGMATSLLPCGLVYAALAIPVASGHAGVGALSMVVFGLATTPALFAVTYGARRLAVRDIRVRRALAAAVLIAGLASIGLRNGLVPGAGADGHSGHAPAQMSLQPSDG